MPSPHRSRLVWSLSSFPLVTSRTRQVKQLRSAIHCANSQLYLYFFSVVLIITNKFISPTFGFLSSLSSQSGERGTTFGAKRPDKLSSTSSPMRLVDSIVRRLLGGRRRRGWRTLQLVEMRSTDPANLTPN